MGVKGRRYLLYLGLLLLSVVRSVLFYVEHGTDFASATSFETSNHVSSRGNVKSLLSGWVVPFRSEVAAHVRQHLPSPHSELLLGLTLGINELNHVPKFNDVVRTVGTIHVIVVSGYNISLVFILIIGLVGSKYNLRSMLLAQLITLFYAVIAGFEPPIVRAWIMGALVVWGDYYGRSINVLSILAFSGLAMVVYNPLYITSLSFQLSFLATFGLIYYSDLIKGLFTSTHVVVQDLVATLSAQILVWPLIAYEFGQLSLISPIVNALTLWTIPIATILGGLFIISSVFLSYFGILFGEILLRLFARIVLIPLDVFIQANYFFSKFPLATISIKLGLPVLISYYLIVLLIPLIMRYRSILRYRAKR